MTAPVNPYFILAGGSALGGIVMWAYKKVRNGEIQKNFVRDVATNHLPHIYHTNRQFGEGLNRLLESQGCEKIDFNEPPPIQFIELNGHEKKR